MDEFKKLVALFPEGDEFFAHIEHVPAALTPEPFKWLLVHDRHMTLRLEEFHRSSVTVKVLERKLEGEFYSRKILLRRSDDGVVVQFALVRCDLSVVSPAIRDEILSEQTPLGHILVKHNIFRVVQLGAILQISAGPAFARLCGCSDGQSTYGRLATIFCNGRPAVDLFEAVVPIEIAHARQTRKSKSTISA